MGGGGERAGYSRALWAAPPPPTSSTTRQAPYLAEAQREKGAEQRQSPHGPRAAGGTDDDDASPPRLTLGSGLRSHGRRSPSPPRARPAGLPPAKTEAATAGLHTAASPAGRSRAAFWRPPRAFPEANVAGGVEREARAGHAAAAVVVAVAGACGAPASPLPFLAVHRFLHAARGQGPSDAGRQAGGGEGRFARPGAEEEVVQADTLPPPPAGAGVRRGGGARGWPLPLRRLGRAPSSGETLPCSWGAG